MTVTTPLGRVERDGDRVSLVFERSYRATVDDVWSALTDPDRTARWFGRWTGDPATGTVEVVMSAEADDGAAEQVTIVECVPPTRLVVETGTPDGVWRLAVELSAHGGGTRLRFVQHLAEPHDASSIGPGWHFYLDRLGAVVAGVSVPNDWDAYFPALKDAYPVPG